jgi:probable HAF family extracellular repeat protein
MSRRTSNLWSLGTVLSTLGAAAFAHGQATFRGLGTPSYALAISSDGSTVVGVAQYTARAFRWTEAGGVQDLGVLPGGLDSIAWAVNADGSVVVGEAHRGAARHAFRWTAATGMVDLGVPQGSIQSFGLGVSGDGQVVCGRVEITPATGFRWTASEGFTLFNLPPGVLNIGESHVSADGATIVGAGNLAGGQVRAYRWTAAAGTELLPVPAGTTWSKAYVVSEDGSAAVGDVSGSSVSGILRWTGTSGFQLLEGAPAPNGASSDCSILVGTVDGAAIWSPQRGLQHVQTLLGAAVPAGWILAQGWGVSGDGLRITGWGYNPDGEYEGWVATLTPGMLTCYPNCDLSGVPPVLNVNDFLCFLSRFATGDSYANCDQSTSPPILNVNEFVCFTGAFAAGCS